MSKEIRLPRKSTFGRLCSQEQGTGHAEVTVTKKHTLIELKFFIHFREIGLWWWLQPHNKRLDRWVGERALALSNTNIKYVIDYSLTTTAITLKTKKGAQLLLTQYVP